MQYLFLSNLFQLNVYYLPLLLLLLPDDALPRSARLGAGVLTLCSLALVLACWYCGALSADLLRPLLSI